MRRATCEDVGQPTGVVFLISCYRDSDHRSWYASLTELSTPLLYGAMFGSYYRDGALRTLEEKFGYTCEPGARTAPSRTVYFKDAQTLELRMITCRRCKDESQDLVVFLAAPDWDACDEVWWRLSTVVQEDILARVFIDEPIPVLAWCVVLVGTRGEDEDSSLMFKTAELCHMSMETQRSALTLACRSAFATAHNAV
ncbi:hypothetical protein LTR56_002185 [Elasticomyces elasticus]|nr:hypothetical protein LTR56_002185 [Elasticomyces elasticus]KAK3666064.1 hypothetical protein LTR22_003067 [Elasticomyces elasticus]KAK4929551.1 hypothetical protein LTR49_003846 [Elasticomyces elasticus]KAK5767491.1 hypothetical protein LTS12_002332 [Elasticomyces elasticus]